MCAHATHTHIYTHVRGDSEDNHLPLTEMANKPSAVGKQLPGSKPVCCWKGPSPSHHKRRVQHCPGKHISIRHVHKSFSAHQGSCFDSPVHLHHAALSGHPKRASQQADQPCTELFMRLSVYLGYF